LPVGLMSQPARPTASAADAISFNPVLTFIPSLLLSC
jgi:hypothetical protein